MAQAASEELRKVKDKLARLTKASKNLTLRLQHQVIVEKRWSVFEGENARFDEVTKEELAARTKTLDVSMLCAGPAMWSGVQVCVYKNSSSNAHF